MQINEGAAVLREFERDIKGYISTYWNKRSNTYDIFPIAHSEEEEKAAQAAM